MDGKRYLRDLEVAMEPIGRLQEYASNAKIHTAAQIEQIKNSITEFGFNDPIAVWTNKSGKSEIVEGHGRLQAALELGMAEVPVIHLDGLTDAQRRAYTHVHNQLTMTTGWDYEKLDADIEELDFDFTEFGFDLPEEDVDADQGEQPQSMRESLGFVPFSVIRADAKDWLDRKRQWVALGIRSELGRGGGADVRGGSSGKVLAVPGGSPLPLNRRR